MASPMLFAFAFYTLLAGFPVQEGPLPPGALTRAGEREAARLAAELVSIPLTSQHLHRQRISHTFSMRWAEVRGTISAGQAIALTLANGATIEGRVFSIGEEGLDVHVLRTSNATAYPVGPNTISSGLVCEIAIDHQPSGWDEVAGSMGSVIGLMLLESSSAMHGDRFGEREAFHTGAAAVMDAGSYPGRPASGRQITVIRVQH